MIQVRLAASLLVTGGVAGCPEAAPPGRDNVRDPVAAPTAPAPVPARTAPVYAPQTGRPALQADREGTPFAVSRALHPDSEYANDQLEPVRRFVYRVTLRVPSGLGRAPVGSPTTAAELFIDVSEDRLRATFSGPGWPLEAGAQVRLRRDRHGSYAFDSRGGRPYGHGRLSEWFQGGRMRAGQAPLVGIQAGHRRDGTRHGDLVCAFLAEWARQDRASLMRRCARRDAPTVFRLGPWRGERTADVPMEVARSELRADEGPPHPVIEASSSSAYLSADELRRLAHDRPAQPTEAQAQSEGLVVTNAGSARAIVIVRGTPMGWVGAGATLRLRGLAPGTSTVAAIRPLGTLAFRPRRVRIPGEIVIR